MTRGSTPLHKHIVPTPAPLRRENIPGNSSAADESRWSFALEAARQGVWDHDLIRGKVFHSSMWREMRGFGPQEDVDAEMGPWLDRLHPDDREIIRAITEQQNRGELEYNAFEYRERHRDGHWIWILSRGKPVEWLPDGTVARILGTDTDITSLKKIESELAAEKERLKITLQSIADGMISTDAEGLITFINPAAENMLQCLMAEVIGHPIAEMLNLEDSAGETLCKETFAQCVSRAEIVRLAEDTRLIGRDGTWRFVQISVSPVVTPELGMLGTVFVFRDTTESQNLRKRLAHTATHDALTGLPNRVAFEEALNIAVGTAQRDGREHTLCFIDLDWFKQVNDGAGHAAGDEVLKGVAACLVSILRSNDLAARVGGDEFTILLSDCSVVNGQRIAGKIVEAIARLDFCFEGRSYRLGASIGVTAVSRHPVANAVYIGEADAACYAAKAAGRGRVVVYSEQPPQPALPNRAPPV